MLLWFLSRRARWHFAGVRTLTRVPVEVEATAAEPGTRADTKREAEHRVAEVARFAVVSPSAHRAQLPTRTCTTPRARTGQGPLNPPQPRAEHARTAAPLRRYWSFAPTRGRFSEVSQLDRELRSQLDAAYDADGVDRSLIRRNLTRTPAERLAQLEANVAFLKTARRVEDRIHGAVPRDPEDAP